MTRRLALIVNPSAGGGRAASVAQAARSELHRRGASYRVIETTGLDHAREAAADAARGGETVVAVGGDGLTGALAGALRHSPGSLALVPAGRGNDLARVLGVPLDPAGAARVAVEGEERLIDLGEVHGRAFAAMASFGLDSEAARIANESRVPGRLVYAYGGLRALMGWRHAGFEVSVDGREHHFSGYSVAVANARSYGGGMLLVPHAELDDGRLDVLMVSAASRLRLLLQLPRVFRGTHVGDPMVGFERGEVIQLRADRPFTVYADGEPVGELPATARVDRHCLRVIAPRAS